MITWFKAIESKKNKTFILFDIVSFYPSISHELLTTAITWAKNFCDISKQEEHIIFHAKNTLLYNKGTPWVKKQGTFDVTMGSFDGAETCELVGLYLLSELEHIGVNLGIYRDDALGETDKTPHAIDQTKKKIKGIFLKHKLKITIEVNKTNVDFLDVTLDLQTGKYKPYTKPGNTPQYVHSQSNHPPTVLRNIPDGINKRLCAISSDETVFQAAVPAYQEALQKAGYKHKLSYTPQTQNENTRKNRTRKRKTHWYNPPYNAQVKTQIGKRFLQIIDKCFPTGHPLHKLFNRNTVKISYSCMPNMQCTISKHNKQVLQKHNTNSNETTTDNSNNTNNKTQKQAGCNCRNKAECPVPGDCLQKGVIYQATVTRKDNNSTKNYIGLTAGTFKKRHGNHKSDFKHCKYRKSTTLSEHIWKLKDKNIDFEIKWKYVDKGVEYKPGARTCNLCNKEKYYIIFKPEMAQLNKRNELTAQCRHRRAALLVNC